MDITYQAMDVHLNLKLPEFLQEYNNTNNGHESQTYIG